HLCLGCRLLLLFFLSFSPPSPAVIISLPLHDALPISGADVGSVPAPLQARLLPAAPRAVVGLPGTLRAHRHRFAAGLHRLASGEDRKSTRLNSSHVEISYAVFCLKNKTIHYYAPQMLS